MAKGKKNLKDLSLTQQFYYDKLIKYFNDNSDSEDECISIIEILDKLIDDFNNEIDDIYSNFKTKINKLYKIIEEYEGD